METAISNQWIRVSWLLIGILSAGVAIQPAIAEDTWWHLAVGRWILDNNAIPKHDPFSQLGQSTPTDWKAYSWLYDLLLIKTYNTFGLEGILNLKIVFSAMTIIALCRYISQTSRTSLSAILIAFTSIPAFWPMLNERPWHMTIIGIICTLSVLDRCLARVTSLREICWIIPLYALWANVHIQFILGLGLMLLAIFTSWIRHHQTHQVSSLATLILLTISCTLITFGNPYHFKLYVVVWEYATQTDAMEMIDELKSPSVSNYWTWSLIAVTCWATINIMRFGFPLWETVLLLAGLFFAIRSQRDVWFGTLLALRAVGRTYSKSPTSTSAVLYPFGGFCLVKLIWVTGLIAKEPIESVVQHRYPVSSVEWIQKHNPDGPIFNSLDWGGYLIWALPNYPVSIDGRTNLYGNDLLRTNLVTWKGTTLEANDPWFSKSRIVVAPKLIQGQELPFVSQLRTSWQTVHEDAVSIVFVRLKSPSQQ